MLTLHKIYFYEDRNGKSPVKEYIADLAAHNSKDNRIKLNKIREYIAALSEYGVSAGEPYIKHLDGAIWELRPIRDRILFAAWDGNDFVLLHCFVKSTQKTPRKEIDRARRNLIDYRERRNNNEKKQ